MRSKLDQSELEMQKLQELKGVSVGAEGNSPQDVAQRKLAENWDYENVVVERVREVLLEQGLFHRDGELALEHVGTLVVYLETVPSSNGEGVGVGEVNGVQLGVAVLPSSYGSSGRHLTKNALHLASTVDGPFLDGRPSHSVDHDHGIWVHSSRYCTV